MTSSYSTTWPPAGFFEEKSATATGKEDVMSWKALKLRVSMCISTNPNEEFLETRALGVWS